MRIVSTEMRRSSLFLATLPISLLWLWIPLSRVEVWRGSWLSATSYTTSATAYVVIVICTLVGLDSARRAGSGLDAHVRTAPRSAWLVAVPRLTATYAMASLPGLVVALVIWLANRESASATYVGADQVVFAALTLAFAVSLSGLAALFTSAPVLGALWGLVVGGLVSFFGDVPLSTAQDVRISAGRQQLLATLCVIVVLSSLALPELFVRLHGGVPAKAVRLLGAVVAVASLSTMVNATGLAGDLRVGRPPPGHSACGAAASVVCVWPDHASYLPTLQSFAGRAESASVPGLGVPERFEEFGLRPGRDATYSFVLQDPTPSGMWVTAGGMADTMVNGALLPDYCEPATQAGAERRSALVANLHFWLRARIYGGSEPAGRYGGGPDTDQAEAVLRREPTAQRAWVEDSLREVRGLECAL